MIKIVFNSKYPEAVATHNYGKALGRIDGVSNFDWDNYDKYDVALFMPYEEDLHDLSAAKRQNPHLLVGLIDPRGSKIEEFLQYIDFFIIDSLEMKDFFARYRLPMFTYYEYPDVPTLKRAHREKDTIIIGYHGNKVHLASMYPHLTKALELLGREYSIEFWAVYNIERLGRWEMGVPEGISVRHIQWHENVYEEELAKVDIGVVPGLMPIKDLQEIKRKCAFRGNYFLETDDDYLLRFKVPSNPGRIIIFAKLGVPVVADFFLSALQRIRDGENGFLAYSCSGWYTALKELIQDPQLRNTFSCNMLSAVEKQASFDNQNADFVQFLDGMRSRDIQMPDVIRETTDQLKIGNEYTRRVENSRLVIGIKHLKRRIMS
jgi:hypothetical protein|tara:strand:+ start:674 stop:1801 length:1128 start_codon:yes stop_codon:yes gene_type:complete